MTIRSALSVIEHPARFALQVLRSFGRNQGLLLAGAIAYYALLSLVPLLILCVLGLSHFIDQADLLATLRRYLDWLVPTQSDAVLADISGFLDNGAPLRAVLLVTMMFFSS
ncbi:MAG TPA: YhjD/YihY/BrkB family envelope integrity protein, partial [Rhodocyclaceae bacterium]